ncbi:glycoprotease [Coprinopsis cinerea okayama7|uniref:N(6)-L-threonylcarbamoyladenine synthase n=1 Tax=Coprinopsis cinerea (strain Okayama-7 / 130 / ATCC MYA-4618 / FGSC 9003) TaxID=240176 RepID=A8N6L1_COPC7|nr:glycoprotease [Coprinopsis cinerea okayama7\|eukprot:XP_001830467.1 glycoprotease [Coprinopsis cinerea okayama7\
MLRSALLARPRVPPLLPSVQKSPFTILAIESSADDTCAAVVDSSKRILSNVVLKQLHLHEKYGGIEPITAIQAHQRNMPLAVSRALKEANVDIVRDVNGIAFTRGPGMPSCLSVGMNAAQTLGAALGKPVIGVHHMQGHALTPLLTSDEANMPQFPFLTLLVSGGHTLILLAESNDKFKILADTADQAIGRVIDKVTALLAIPWTSLGPGDALEKFCQDVPDSEKLVLGQPVMRGRKDFSFSGLHSQVERYIHAKNGIEQLSEDERRVLAYSFQDSAFSQLEEKIQLAFSWCQSQSINVRHLVVSGGVASNQRLRQRLDHCLSRMDPDNPIQAVFPPPNLCTDNAVMIAWASMHRFLAGESDSYDLNLRAKWSIEDLASKVDVSDTS